MARNVMLLIADDWSPLAKTYGNDVIQTPHIDALAERGVTFDHAFCVTPSCAASRASLLTGRPPHENGQYGHCHGNFGFRTRETMVTVPQVLQAGGARSALVGKAHVLPREVYPFDYSTQLGGAGGPADAWHTPRLRERAEEFLGGVGDTPFYLHVGSMWPHRERESTFPGDTRGEVYAGGANPGADVGYDPADVIVPGFMPDHPEVRAELADYYRYVSRFDHFVGEMVAALEASGRADETLIIVMSDHGMPFVGAKASNFDTGHHCPLIIAHPDGVGAGTHCDALVNWLDLTPTVYEWMGVESHAPDGLTGRSVLSILGEQSPAGWDETTFAHCFHGCQMNFPYRALRGRRFKYIRNLATGDPMPIASDLFRSRAWQATLKHGLEAPGRSMHRTLHHDPEALFDIENDPLETTNLIDAPEHAAVVSDMRSRLLAWREQTDDPWLELDRQRHWDVQRGETVWPE